MSETFRSVLRGYDPVEVDGHLKKLREERDKNHREAAAKDVELEKMRAALQAAEQHINELGERVRMMEQAERDSAPPTYADLGQRIGSILTLAHEEASEMRANAQQEAERLRGESQTEYNRIVSAAEANAAESRSRAEADAARHIEEARRAADELLDQADREAGARREEAEAVYEHQRARAAAAAAEFERTLAERRDRSAADFARALAAQDQKLAAAEERLTSSTQEADRLLTDARTEADDLLTRARAEAQQLLSSAKDRAERVKRESDRELAAAAARRDAITAQLSNVRQMLATLGGAAGLAEPAAEAAAAAAGDEVEEQV